MIPGAVTAVAVMLLSLIAAKYLGEFFKAQLNLQKSPISTFLLAIIFGRVARNIIKFPKVFEPGFKYCVVKLLRLGTLIAAGTAICGVSAVVATAPTIGAKEEETAHAISTITIFGLLATVVYPFLAELVLKLNFGQTGIFLGTAVHDTSQVTGAAFIYDQIWNREVSGIAIAAVGLSIQFSK